jgi:hypothetical protein
MNRWKLVVPVACALFMAACGPAPAPAPPPGPSGPPAEVVVNTAPPPEQVEVIPAAPSAEMIWIKGHWHWDRNVGAWNWIRGHYEVRRVGWRWVPAHYEQRGPNWVYIGPHWAQ